jgi:hypothetical protein
LIHAAPGVIDHPMVRSLRIPACHRLVDIDDAVVDNASERFPSRHRIADRNGQVGFRRDLRKRVFEPAI